MQQSTEQYHTKDRKIELLRASSSISHYHQPPKTLSMYKYILVVKDAWDWKFIFPSETPFQDFAKKIECST
jgi:hypothetical protein